jgi:hypothetical protein
VRATGVGLRLATDVEAQAAAATRHGREFVLTPSRSFAFSEPDWPLAQDGLADGIPARSRATRQDLGRMPSWRLSASGSSGGRPVTFHRTDYRGRSVIERAFNGFNTDAGRPTGYGKHAIVYRGGLALAAANDRAET